MRSRILLGKITFSSSSDFVYNVLIKYCSDIFVNEAYEVDHYLRGIHHSRKISHMQVNYPETVHRLSKLQLDRTLNPATINYKRPATQHVARVTEMKVQKLKDFENNMKEYINKERFMNIRKKEYNREVGRKAVANQVNIVYSYDDYNDYYE
jgi:hypothetical protein